ncbi:tetratricopeptide repeat protein [Candidatus Nitrospira allomarina]|uniref:Tetratricopeptide repeat protein n=1 Tax=Candidatus Nitrospira allomarina TaxID=3020900 RepID=A0AA96JTC6_9BACT|nr:tetratricopeptide repeat protein [Candidatus Nitrospira allomarina]WNM59293.1 tetratricopeptide repeat protein [Candidatus Nitrospira allomarina]
MTWSTAQGSHLTLPGSQDLSHGDESDLQPFIRQLEKINNYIPPQAQPDRKNAASSKIEHSTLPTHSLHPSPTEPKPTGFEQSHSSPSKKPIHIAILLHNNDTEDQTNTGWRSLLNGRPGDAIAAYQESLRIDPKSAEAYLGMGIALKSLGFIDHAKDAIQQALELNPHLSSALVHLGYLYADGHIGPSDSKAAHRLFSQATQLGDPFASIALLDLQSRSRPRS